MSEEMKEKGLNSRLTTAVGTPLTVDEALHEAGLECHLADQAKHGIENILVAGSMGAMQLLTNQTYRDVVTRSVTLWSDKGELLVGAGDAGFSRSRDRIRFLNDFKIDGVAVLAPYFWGFSQPELVEYFSALADESNAPLYLYDLPQVTGTKLSMETLLKLAKHPNIAGAKVSGDFGSSRNLMDTVGEEFRVIVAQASISDVLFHHGVCDQLDGIWCVTTAWITTLAKASDAGDWETAATCQRKINAVLDLLPKYGFSAFTNLMNARGIPGTFTPRPFARLSEAQNEELLNESIVKQLIEEDPALV